jgi:glucose/arabinose dehydrogenase
MMRHGWSTVIALIAVVAILATTSPVAAQDQAFEPEAFDVGLELKADGLNEPLFVTHSGDERLFVLERTGTIRVLVDDALLDTPFLDLTSQVGSDASERGLLGLAFAPNYGDSGLFYVNYTDLNGDTVVSRFRVSDDPDVADAGSEEIILAQPQPYWNHNGGMIAFGPDNYLYIGLGDGGGGGDPEGNGQRLDTLLGKILRIEVDPEYTDGEPYAIPEDNPFVGEADARPEIWAYGLRNPWRFSFDRETGDLWIADVGQGEHEEVNMIGPVEAGANFGWNVVEGPACYAVSNCNPDDFVAPVFSYTHSEGGCSVTGGYVYRGEEFADLYGVYVLADYCSGLIWAGGLDASGDLVFSDPVETGMNISSFGEDMDGTVYLTDLNGGLYELVPPL